jgi:hypothetical protein
MLCETSNGRVFVEGLERVDSRTTTSRREAWTRPWHQSTGSQRRRRKLGILPPERLLYIVLLLLCFCFEGAVSAPSSSKATYSKQQKPQGATPARSSSSSSSSTNENHNINDADTLLLRQLVQDLQARMKQSSALAGRFSRLRSNLFRVVSKQELRLVVQCIQTTMQASWQDLMLLVTFGFGLVPLVTWFLPLKADVPVANGSSEFAYQATSSRGSKINLDPPSYQESYSRNNSAKQSTSQPLILILARSMQQLAQIALLVHTLDLVQMLAIGLGYTESDATTDNKRRSLSQWACSTLYAVWGTHKTSLVVQWMVRAWLERTQNQAQLTKTKYSSSYQQNLSTAMALERLQQVASCIVYASATLGWLVWNILATASTSDSCQTITSSMSLPAALTLGAALVGVLCIVSLQDFLQQVWSGCLYVFN